MVTTRRICWMACACMLGLAALAAPVGAVDPNYLPDDAELVLTINLQQILKSELAKSNKDAVTQLKFLLDGQLADVGAQRYLERLDFDLFRDVTRITVATDGGKMPNFVLLEGKFNAEKLNAIGEEASRDNAEHIKGVKIAGQQAFEIRINADDRPVFAGVYGKDKLIAADSKDGFADAIARLKGSARPSKLKKELRELLGPAAAKQSITLATTGPALVKLLEGTPVPNIEDLQEVLGGIKALNVSITVAKNAAFELVVNAKDKKSADDMAKLAGVGVAGAKLLLKKKVETDPQYAPALDIVNTLRVTSQGTNFVLRGEIAAADLAKLLKELPK